MIIHFLLLAIIYVLSYFFRKRYPGSLARKVIFVTMSVLLILFIGLRDINVGMDTSNYVSMFRSGDWPASNLEVAFPIIGRITGIITDHYFLFLVVTSAIAIFGVLYSARKYNFDTEIFMFLYITSFCYVYSTSAVRFFCALSVILFAINYMINKKMIKTILLIFLAMLFHTSAILFIPVYFLTLLELNKKNVLLIIILMMSLLLAIEVTGGSGLFGVGIFEKYSYIEQSTNIQFGPSIIINAITLFLAYAYYKDINEYKKEFDFFIKVLIIGSFIDLISIAYRAVWFFKFPSWFIVSILLKNLKNKDRKAYYLLYFLTVALYCVYYYMVLASSYSSHHLLDYKFNVELN